MQGAPLEAEAAPAEAHAGTRAHEHSRRPDIDGLRAVSILAVLVYHLQSSWLPGGFAGVDVFFVISGYVVSASMMLKRRTTRVSFIVSFYARRVKRLLPALTFVLLSTALLFGIFVPTADQNRRMHEYWQTGLFAAAGCGDYRQP